jgi:hypothetical protein
MRRIHEDSSKISDEIFSSSGSGESEAFLKWPRMRRPKVFEPLATRRMLMHSSRIQDSDESLILESI